MFKAIEGKLRSCHFFLLCKNLINILIQLFHYIPSLFIIVLSLEAFMYKFSLEEGGYIKALVYHEFYFLGHVVKLHFEH
jgi:hypothetical protein